MKNDSLKGQHRINEQIRAKEVRIVGDDVEPAVYIRMDRAKSSVAWEPASFSS